MIKKLLLLTVLLIPNLVLGAFATPWQATTTTGLIFPTPINGTYPPVQFPYFNATSTTASSTAANGINLTKGCFAINGTCVGGSTITGSGTAGEATYWTGSGSLGSVATGSVSSSGGITTTAGRSVFGGALAIDCDVASGASPGCLSAANWTTFNNKVATTRALTIAGTASQITSSAGAQDLSADRTWTLSLPSHVIFPSSYQASAGSTTNSTSTSLYVSGATSTVFANGLVLNAGCVQVNGTCIGGSNLTGSGAANRAAFWTAAGNLSYDDTFVWDNSNKRLGLGGVPSYPLHVSKSYTDETGTNILTFYSPSITATVDSAASYRGLQTQLLLNGSKNYTDYNYGFLNQSINQGSGVVSNLYGGFSNVHNTGGGTTTNAFGFASGIVNNAGTTTNAYSLAVASPAIAGGSVTNLYGLYVPSITGGTNNYSIYSTDGTGYFGGNLEFTEITLPSPPASNNGKLYIKDDGVGTTRIYFQDSLGSETDLTGGGGGCTTFDCLTDVTLLTLASSSVPTYNGAEWVDNILDFGWLTGSCTIAQGCVGITSYTAGDLLYASGASTLSKLGIGASGKFLTSNGSVPLWGDAMDLNSHQTVTTGIKTFSMFPETTGTPTTTNQLVNKGYVDAFALGVKYKDPVRLATTSDITKSGLLTIDGVSTTAGDRILVSSSTSTPPNGCYVAAIGAWARCTDYDTAAEVQRGTSFSTLAGTVNAGFLFSMSSPDVVTLGTDPITFSRIVLPVYTASRGVTLSGNDFQASLGASGGLSIFGGSSLWVDHDNSTLATSSGKLAVKTAGITGTQLAVGSVDLTSTDVTGTNPVSKGGTNLTGALDDNLMVGNGTTWQTKALTDCDSALNALTYDVTGNNFGCNTISGGGGGGGNATTTVEIIIYGNNTTARTWTNMPAAATELFGSTDTRKRVDLTYATQYRVKARTTTACFGSGATQGDLNLRYTSASTTLFAATTAADTGGAGEMTCSGATGLREGSWTNLVAGAKNDVYILIATKDGNGVIDPIFTQVTVEFRIPAGSNLTGAGSANRAAFWTSSSALSYDDAFVWHDSTNRFGLGTTTPGTLLSLGDTGNDTINISATATSTFGSGLNIRTGCYAMNGVCVGGLVNPGTAGQFTYYGATGSAVSGTSSIFVNTTNSFFGIGTAAPAAGLDIQVASTSIAADDYWAVGGNTAMWNTDTATGLGTQATTYTSTTTRSSLTTTNPAFTKTFYYQILTGSTRFGMPVTVRSCTFYYHISGTGTPGIDTNRWYTSNGVSVETDVDNDTTDITGAGSGSHTSALSNLVLKNGETLLLEFTTKVNSPGGSVTGIVQITGIQCNYDTD